MSSFTGDDGTRYELFGTGGGASLAEDLGVPLLAELAFVPAVRVGGDTGEPVAAADPTSEIGRAFASLATRIAAQGPARVYRQEPGSPESVLCHALCVKGGCDGCVGQDRGDHRGCERDRPCHGHSARERGCEARPRRHRAGAARPGSQGAHRDGGEGHRRRMRRREASRTSSTYATRHSPSLAPCTSCSTTRASGVARRSARRSRCGAGSRRSTSTASSTACTCSCRCSWTKTRATS